MTQRIDFGFITATISTFRPSEGGITEHHVVLTCQDGMLPFQQQLDGIFNAYQQLLSTQLKGAVAV